MRSRLIVNPVAGRDTASTVLPELNERLRAAVGALEVVMTVGQGDAERMAELAARDGVGRIFVAGGDGTLNEVINGVARVEGAFARTELALLPLGTGNDFARSLDVGSTLEEALDVALGGSLVQVDVGVLNERRFVNVSAGGFIAEASSAVDPALKTVAGRLAYLVGGAMALGEYDAPMARVRLVQSGGVFERTLPLQLFAVCNARLIGGGRLIAPHAVLDDGWLDVCLVEAMPVLEFVRLLVDVAGGEHVADPRVLYFQAREVEIELDRVAKVNTDGEVLEARRCRYRVLPRAARFRAGAGAHIAATPAPLHAAQTT